MMSVEDIVIILSNPIFLIIIVTIILPFLFAYLIYRFAYNISEYSFIKKRMNERKTIALLLIEQDGKLLFRKKKGAYLGREEYKDTWVLPGGEVGLDEEIQKIIQPANGTEIPLHIWAVAYARSQIGIKISCPDKYSMHPFIAPYEGGILMGYPPGRIAICCGEIIQDENTKDVIRRILNNEVDDKKFFTSDQIRAMSQFFHPFYIKHLDEIVNLRAKIEREVSEKKLLDNKAIEKLRNHIKEG